MLFFAVVPLFLRAPACFAIGLKIVWSYKAPGSTVQATKNLSRTVKQDHAWIHAAAGALRTSPTDFGVPVSSTRELRPSSVHRSLAIQWEYSNASGSLVRSNQSVKKMALAKRALLMFTFHLGKEGCDHRQRNLKEVCISQQCVQD